MPSFFCSGAGLTGAQPAENGDIAALAKGGRTNVFGFLLRLAARIPFLLVAGRLYGPEALGRFAYAILAVEFVGQLGTLGLRRGLAELLSHDDRPHAHIIADGMLIGIGASAIGVALLFTFPWLMFPNSPVDGFDRFLPFIIFALVTTDIALAALAYRFDVASAVRARAVVEPWTISISAWALYYVTPRDGLILAYVASLVAALIFSLWPLWRSYGLPWGWRPHPGRLMATARHYIPLAAADAAEWGSRRLDVAILGQFASPTIVGIYYGAQQVASLPQKLKTSFDPILGPAITRNLKVKQHGEIARLVGQVGFWIVAAQAGVALSLGISGEAIMGLLGPEFVGGAAALAFLLAAEVMAAPSVVSEAALVYLARHKNLAISLVMLALQAGLSVLFILLVDELPAREDMHGLLQGAAVALALMLSLLCSSIVKKRLLTRILERPIAIWRWALIWAAAAAVIAGFAVTQVPEWLELVGGIPLILGLYCWVIWTRGFGDDDRILFRRHPKN